jgi:2-polyprenyl-3-methyl-5-hydroxy-6-metoxy-1,4-benzoquinol methylase
MANFNIYYVKTSEFYRAYEDLVLSISAALSDLGHSCTVRQNVFAPGCVNILIGSTIFASRLHSLPSRLQGKPYIVYQLEQLDDGRGLLSERPEYWEVLNNAAAIWDYSPASTSYLKGKGLQNVHHVPPGFHRSLESFRPGPDPDIDVLFFGSPHPRRQHLIDTLKSRGLKIVNLQAAFGEPRNRQIARAKIVLNVHAWEGLAALETVRLSVLLANRSFVISEAADHNPYEDGIVYGPYQDLTGLCVEYLQKAPPIRDRVAEKGYLAIRKLDLVNILQETIAQIGCPALDGLVSEEGYEVNSYYSQPRPDIMKLIPESSRRILDIGCAGGQVGANIKKRQACHITGIEIVADAALQAARWLDLSICGDAFDVLPSLPDQNYDCILMLDVLEHVVDSSGLLRLAIKKLASDGVLVLCVPNVAHWSVVQGLLQGRWDYAEQGILDRTHLRFFTFVSLRQLLQEAGLQIVSGASTRLNGNAPPDVVLDAARRSAPSGHDIETNLQSYQFIFTCRKI